MNSPSLPVTTALVLQEPFEVLILRLWFHSPCKGTLGSSEAFHDSFMPSWNSSKVFAIISTGVNMMLLQLLSCIIQEVNWCSVWKLKMLISDPDVRNNWCESLWNTRHLSPLSYSKSVRYEKLQTRWKLRVFLICGSSWTSHNNNMLW